jgi:hypothetical protein
MARLPWAPLVLVVSLACACVSDDAGSAGADAAEGGGSQAPGEGAELQSMTPTQASRAATDPL